MLKNSITDSGTGKSAEVDATSGEKQALVVATRQLKSYTSGVEFFSNDIYGVDMNQEAGFGGTPDGIYDGGDKVQWTPSAIVGGAKWDFVDADTHAADAVAEVVNFALLAGDTLTITINGVPTILTEGIDWAAAVSNPATATALAVAIDGLAGVSASASGAVVTVVIDRGNDITAITTSDAVNLTSSAQSIDATATDANNVAQFDRGVNIDLSNYVAITGYIFVTKWKNNEDLEFYGWDVGGTQVGNRVNINDYVDTGLQNTWLKFAIPLVDMGLTLAILDGFRLLNTHKGNNFWIDLMQVEETGASIIYIMEPDTGTWFHVETLKIIVGASYNSTIADGTMYGLSYDDILGVTLANGLIYQRVQGDEVRLSVTATGIKDWLQFPEVEISNGMYDGTNTLITIESRFASPEILKSEDLDKLRYIIQDDLSSMVIFRISVGGRIEQRE